MLRDPLARTISGFFHGLHDCTKLQKQLRVSESGRHPSNMALHGKVHQDVLSSAFLVRKYAACVADCQVRMLTGFSCGALAPPRKGAPGFRSFPTEVLHMYVFFFLSFFSFFFVHALQTCFVDRLHQPTAAQPPINSHQCSSVASDSATVCVHVGPCWPRLPLLGRTRNAAPCATRCCSAAHPFLPANCLRSCWLIIACPRLRLGITHTPRAGSSRHGWTLLWHGCSTAWLSLA